MSFDIGSYYEGKQLKVGTNVLPSVAKKKVVAAATSVLSTKAFPMAGLAL
jgi:hypothetical protein